MAEEYPYSDEEMVFDEQAEHYRITMDGLLNNIFIDKHIQNQLSDDQQFKALMQEVSEDIYRFIASNTLVGKVHEKMFVVNYYPPFRKPIKRALLYQARYMLRSAGPVLKDMHGVDVERARSANRANMRNSSHIAPAAIEELENAGILYSGHFDLIAYGLE